ncbi:hypothetical protein TNCV_3469141 [Trichonephila clavipes]|nr:hypothetical protein TNCV_3469141 [Trichonephila clavipes]
MHLTWGDSKFKNDIGVLKRADNSSKTMSILDSLRLPEKLKMPECVHKDYHQTFAQFSEASRRCRLRESIRHKRPYFWQSNDWYLSHDNAPAQLSQLVKEFLTRTRTNVLPQPSYSQDLVSWDFYLFQSMKKHLQVVYR